MLMTYADEIQSTLRRIYDNDLEGLVESLALSCDIHEGVIDTQFILADYDN